MGQVIDTGRRRRRRHSAQFKAEVVGACQQSGVSIAAIALARGVRHDRGMSLSHEQLQAIVVGLPWERLDERAKIRVL